MYVCKTNGSRLWPTGGDSPDRRRHAGRVSSLGLWVCLIGTWVLFLLGTSRVAAAAPVPSVSDSNTAEEQVEQGLIQFQHGRFDEAIRFWQDAAEAFRQAGRPARQARAHSFLAEASRALGRHQQAFQHLELALVLAQDAQDPVQVAGILGTMGKLYLDAGMPDAATDYLGQASELAGQLELVEVQAAVLNDQGILLTMQAKHEEALQRYTKSLRLALTVPSHGLAARALMNQARSAIPLTRYTDARTWLEEAYRHLQFAEASHDKAYALVTLGLLAADLREHLPSMKDALMLTAFSRFEEAARLADTLSDARAASYAWGHLGHLYELEHRHAEALSLTRRALSAAQSVEAPEALYQWQWQAGRLLAASGKLDEAIRAYRGAVYTVQTIRQELARRLQAEQASFREAQQPLYFELADLLLKRADLTEDGTAVESYLLEARDIVELLKAAELRNYFRDECVDVLQRRITKLDVVSPKSAVIYPILFPDRTELLVSLPDGIRRVAVPIGEARMTQEVRQFRKLLEKRTSREYLLPAQQLYTWLIQPLESLLAGRSITTLVFIPDGALRTVPMAALHDGKRFLIQQYAVATTPGLTLTDPRPIQRERIRVLASGLTEPVQGFPPLPHVSKEIQTIQHLFDAAPLMNQDFVATNFEQELRDKPFTIVHIASHGKFAGDVENTFVLTFDGKLTMDQLGRFVGLFRFREDPLELLTLSACETAAGDDQAALGLAGVGIKAGAKSALATLWFINDEASSTLVAEFYRQLHDNIGISKAEALQRAQLKLLEDVIYEHPAYWSPFLLLNNWL